MQPQSRSSRSNLSSRRQATPAEASDTLRIVIEDWLPPKLCVKTLWEHYPDVLKYIVDMRNAPREACVHIDALLFQKGGERPLSFDALVELSNIKDFAQAQVKGFQPSAWDELHSRFS